ncbi:MAG: enoyl-CoA hydratase/isomerase family protein [Streptomyces sp.]|jgi:enoyl-CoA hydratase/carnithine racemase|nr:enoyl-CoA hydratase/isomerase family protein [Streptomyces sp.]
MTGTGAVGVHRDGGVVTVLIGHGHRANALGHHDWRVLAALFDDLATDPTLEAVIVSGRGRKTFSAGSDLREWLGAEPDAVDASFDIMEDALTALERIPVPTVARVRGSAVGAGCQLACACDFRVITQDARLGMPVARWGILTPPMFATRLALLGGPAVALDLLLTGRLVTDVEAVRLGLVTRAVPDAELDDATAVLVSIVTAHPRRRYAPPNRPSAVPPRPCAVTWRACRPARPPTTPTCSSASAPSSSASWTAEPSRHVDPPAEHRSHR